MWGTTAARWLANRRCYLGVAALHMGILFVSNAEKMSRLCTVLVLAACLVASAAAADFVIENASRRVRLLHRSDTQARSVPRAHCRASIADQLEEHLGKGY